MKITAMLRVQNEGRWLREVLASIQPLTEDILILDDHSTDDTVQVAASMKAAVLLSPFPAGKTDEVRDKNLLLEAARLRDPDYILAIDGDEVLEAGAAATILRALKPGIAVFGFRVRYIWNDRQHYRADGVYRNFQRASMFSLINQGDLQYRAVGEAHCNFHCGNIPTGLRGVGSIVQPALLHLGYMHAEDRIRKFHWYNERDPNNHYEDCYRHMVLGDLPEYPPETVCKHGGPLKVFTLSAKMWPTTSPIR